MASIFFSEPGSQADAEEEGVVDAMDLELPMHMPPISVVAAAAPSKKKKRVTAASTVDKKKSLEIPKDALHIVSSYVDKSQSALLDREEKTWGQKLPPSAPSIYAGQNSVSPKVAKEAIALGQVVGSTAPPQLSQQQQHLHHPAGISILDPRMVSDKEKHIGEALQGQLNAMAAKKILATDKKTLDQRGKMPVDSMLKGLFEDFAEICKQTTKQMLTSTTAGDAMLIEGEQNEIDCPILSRSYLADFLRAPVTARHERPCSFGTKCQSHSLFEYYKKKTGDGRTEAGPQFLAKQKSFELREFLLPHQQTRMEDLVRTQSPEQLGETLATMEHLPCLLCSRYMTSHLATHFCMQYDDVSTSGTDPQIVQNHGNWFSREGEYQPEAMLQRGNGFSGLIAPIVEFDRDHYVPFYHKTAASRDPVVGWAESDAIIFRMRPGSALLAHSLSSLPQREMQFSSLSSQLFA